MVFKRYTLLSISLFLVISVWAKNVDDIMRDGQAAINNNDYNYAISIYEQLTDKHLYNKKDASTCKGLEYGGNCCIMSGRYIEALRFYTLAIESAQRNGNEEVALKCTNNIGNIYALFDDYQHAIFYYKKANRTAISHRDEDMIATTSANLAKAYCYVGDIEKARKYLNIQMLHPLQDPAQNRYTVCINQALISRIDKNYSAAKYYLDRAMETVTFHKMGDGLKAEILNEYGKVANSMNENEKAIAYYKQAVRAASSTSNYEILNESYHLLSDTYKKLNMADSTRIYQSLYLNLSDSIFNKQRFNKGNNSLFEYENQITDEHIGNLKHTIQWLAVAVVFALIILSVIYYYHRKLRNNHRILVQNNLELIKQNDENKKIREADKNKIISLQNKISEFQKDKETGSNDDTSKLAAQQTNELPLDSDFIIELQKRILDVMDHIETISNPDFNLVKLSKLVQSNTRYVSFVINEVYGKNFKTFLNEYRIREASRRLMDEKNYGNLTILAIAETVGFTSLNGFTIAFKKIVGMTPSAFRKLNRE